MSAYNVTNKKNFIISISDFSKIHINLPIVGHYA